jgi:hypothetical protein
MIRSRATRMLAVAVVVGVLAYRSARGSGRAGRYVRELSVTVDPGGERVYVTGAARVPI